MVKASNLLISGIIATTGVGAQVTIDKMVVDGDIVWPTDQTTVVLGDYNPPIYTLMDDLVIKGAHTYVKNSAPETTPGEYDGQLVYSADGTPYTPTDYTKGGRLNLPEGVEIRTNFTPLVNRTLWQNAVWNVDSVTGTFDRATLHYYSDNTIDVYVGSSSNTMALIKNREPFTWTGNKLVLVDGAPEWTTVNPSQSSWVATALPSSGDWGDVLDYGLIGDGVTDNTSALNVMAADTNITNWYFPIGGDYVLDQVVVPSHVVAIHGGGTITCKDPGATQYHKGALVLNTFGNNTADNFVLDGLSFAAQDNASDQRVYGIVTIDHGEQTAANTMSIDHLEIRNCSWDSVFSGGGKRESLKMFVKTALAGEPEQQYSNMRVYNNTFNGTTGHFDFELGAFLHGNPFRVVTPFPGAHIHNNTFTGGGSALSFVNHWSYGGSVGDADTAYIYDNEFHDRSWGIECGANHGVHIHNNYMTGIKLHPIITTTNYNVNTVINRKNYIYNNHVEGVYVDLDDFGGCQSIYSDLSEWSGNYILGQMRFILRDQGYGPTGEMFGHFHHNTVVSHDNATSSFRHPIFVTTEGGLVYTTGLIEHNDVYGNDIYSNGISVSGVSSAVGIAYNNINLIGGVVDNPCVTDGAGTQTSNVCVHDYTGSIPTSKVGAGLTNTQSWTPSPLPALGDRFDVTDYGLAGNGVTDDSSALESLALNTNVTNWYFPSGHTFLLVGVIPPPHVTHIWGEGTLKRKITGQSWQAGVLTLYHTVVVDGISVINGTGTWAGSASIGQIVISYLNPDLPEWSSDQMEIRNCSFDGSGITSDAISVFTGYNYDGNHPEFNHKNKHKNLKIYDNTFVDSGHFSIEIGDRPIPSAQAQNGYLGLEIFGNTVLGGSGFSLDHIASASAAKVHNNTFDGATWAVELASTGGVHVFNNYMVNMRGHPIVANGFFARGTVSGERDEFVTNEWNYVYKNHIESVDSSRDTERIRLYAGALVEIYDNYLKTAVWVDQTQDAASSHDPYGYAQTGPNIHNNTIVSEVQNLAVYVYHDTTVVNIADNDVYTQGSTGHGIFIAATVTNVTGGNNNINMVNGGTCTTNFTNAGGTCDTSYTGSVPISRLGAGLAA